MGKSKSEIDRREGAGGEPRECRTGSMAMRRWKLTDPTMSVRSSPGWRPLVLAVDPFDELRNCLRDRYLRLLHFDPFLAAVGFEQFVGRQDGHDS